MNACRIYFAPMEGITDVIYRRLHHQMFSGVDKYFMPFISPTQHLTFSSRETRELSPAENEGVPVVPQILTKNAEYFNIMAIQLADAGYREINLNMGCPSGTVTAKGKGAGMLRDLEYLKTFLDAIFASPPLPISIKTRIGFDTTDEWEKLSDILSQYPIGELIVHPRTRSEGYHGTPHWDQCEGMDNKFSFPIALNGNVFTTNDFEMIRCRFPFVTSLMLGCGMVANPALAREIKGGSRLSKAELHEFHDALANTYAEKWPPKAVQWHMMEMMSYMGSCFENAEKYLKAIKKSKNLMEYRFAAQALFDSCELQENPAYTSKI